MRPLLPISLLLVVLVVLVYQQVGGHDFVDLDDYIYVVENPNLRAGLTLEAATRAFTEPYETNWIPLTWISLAWDAGLYGRDPAGYLWTNVGLHALATVLLFLFFTRATGSAAPSAFVAAVFAVHPLHVESVAWASERKDVLSGVFFAATLLAYERYARAGRRTGHAVLVAVLLALGLLAKPMLVTVPFVLLLLDEWPLARLRRDDGSLDGARVRAALIEKLPLLLLCAGAAAATFAAQRASGAVRSLEALPLAPRLANAFESTLWYVGRSIWPADLAVFYPLHVDAVSWVAAGACALAIATVTAALWWGARRWPFAIVGWLWFLGMLVPVVGVVQVGLQARADRYTYLPMIGLSVVVAWAAVRLAEARPGLRAAAASAGGLAVAALALSAWQRVGDWQDSMTLFQSALAVTERNYVVHEGLGNAMLREGRIQEAVGQYQKALEIRPGYQRASLGLANAWLQQDQVSRALPLYRRALELDPDDARIAGSYGLALLRVGRFEEAEQKLRHGLRVHAGAAELHTGLGAAAQAQGRPREAIDHYRESLVQNPGYREAANNLAWLLATCPSVRRADEAIALAGLAGREPNALDTLAAAHAAAGRFDDAVRIADAAARDALERRLIQLGSAIRERASLYRQKRPYEEPCEGESSAFGSAPGASPGSVLVD